MRRVPVIESIGQRYGKLTILEDRGFRVLGDKRRMTQVLCRCDCGTEKVVLLNDLRSGKTTTCGFNHQHFQDRSTPAFNFMYDHAYRSRAIKRGLAFDLTKDQFRQITQMECHYCGAPPSQSNVRRVRTGRSTSIYVSNGIDRMDNSNGYTQDNCVPCCSTCNHAKHTMGYEQFLSWVARAFNHIKPPLPKQKAVNDNEKRPKEKTA